jgi:hypothetical protein
MYDNLILHRYSLSLRERLSSQAKLTLATSAAVRCASVACGFVAWKSAPPYQPVSHDVYDDKITRGDSHQPKRVVFQE